MFQLALTDTELYRRGAATLVASWEEYARGAHGAAVERLSGVAVAVFPRGPERAVYNNALLERDLGSAERAGALDAMGGVYAAAGIARFAVWVHETDESAYRELERRGYTLDSTTRAMGMSLEDIRVPRPKVDLAPPDWAESLRVMELPPGFLSDADPTAFEIAIGRLDGQNVGAGIAFDRDGDCGIYNIGTLEHARRRGLATALTAVLVHDARERGCRTASLQSTQMAERIYARVGFRDLGRILEYAPTPAGPIRPAVAFDRGA